MIWERWNCHIHLQIHADNIVLKCFVSIMPWQLLKQLYALLTIKNSNS